jgi:hypothetical protein
MTTIVTTTSTNYSTMVADQGITSDRVHPDMNKIVRQDTWLIAVCGEDRVCDVVQYAARFPKVPLALRGKKIDEWYPWIVTRVVPQIQKAVQQNLHKDYWGTIGESEVLVVTHGHSFLIGETLGITRAEPYWSIGSGGHLAMGSLSEKTTRTDWNSKHAEFAKDAIEAAKLHDPYTRGKVTGYRSYPSGKIMVIAD